ncbi:MAG TPA: DUF4337 family protein [Rhodopila sp.]|nr:DUF4337 family protein [Rhodopila sp.]
MSEALERAQETMEHHGHRHEEAAPDPWSRRVAVLVSALAAALAITGIGSQSSQNEYLTQHVAVSDDWAYYQAKNVRATVKDAEAQLLASLPNAGDPAVQARIKEAGDYAARMRDDPKAGNGMKQLEAQTRTREVERDHAYHRYHSFEYAAGALEIAIVLASVSVVTRMRALVAGAGVIGGLAVLAAICVALNVI